MTRRWLPPLLHSLLAYDRAAFRGDLTAGTTTAVMLVPQAMAYALLAGLEPVVGLYAATVPTAVYAVFGRSRHLAVGPVAIDSLLVALAIAPLAGDDPVRYASYATLLMLMVGCIQLLIGSLGLGRLAHLLRPPVIAGFTSAAALIIGCSQLKYVLGVPIERSPYLHQVLWQAARRIGETHLVTLLIALLCIALLVGFKRWRRRFPRHLAVVALATIAVWWFRLDQVGVDIVGAVPAGLPRFSPPQIDWDIAKALFSSALVLALIAFVEAYSVASALAQKAGDSQADLNPNQEIRAIGLANLGGSFFSGYPITGGFSRSAVNYDAGAKTTLAGLISASGVCLSLLLLMPLFVYLPTAALAAIIMTAVFGLIDIGAAKRLWATNKADWAVMLITFVATLTLGIQRGISIGIVAGLFARRS